MLPWDFENATKLVCFPLQVGHYNPNPTLGLLQPLQGILNHHPKIQAVLTLPFPVLSPYHMSLLNIVSIFEVHFRRPQWGCQITKEGCIPRHGTRSTMENSLFFSLVAAPFHRYLQHNFGFAAQLIQTLCAKSGRCRCPSDVYVLSTLLGRSMTDVHRFPITHNVLRHRQGTSRHPVQNVQYQAPRPRRQSLHHTIPRFLQSVC